MGVASQVGQTDGWIRGWMHGWEHFLWFGFHPHSIPLHPLLLHPCLFSTHDIHYFPPLPNTHTHTHLYTHLCTHAPLARCWICKSTSAPVPNLQPSPCVWYANAANTVSSLHIFPSFFRFPLLPLLSADLPKPANMSRWGRGGEGKRGRKSEWVYRERLQTKPDNDVVMDGCYTHKQACEQQREAGLIREQ